MATQERPQSVQMSFTALVQLATEAWRLGKWLAPQAEASGSAPARYALRQIEQILRQHEIEARDLDGQPYDPGMAAEVVDSSEDPTLPEGQCVVMETMAPLVLWRNSVVQVATVAISKGVQGNATASKG